MNSIITPLDELDQTNTMQVEDEQKKNIEENASAEKDLELTTHNYEDEQISMNYEEFNNEDNFGCGFGQPVLIEEANNLTSANDKISDKFQIFAHKNKNNVSSEFCINSPVKNRITKESFSQEINSINNFKNRTATHQEIKNLELKYNTDNFYYECPDFESYSADQLKQEISKYGMRAGSTKAMVKQLKEIWDFMKLKKLPDQIKTQLTHFLSDDKKEIPSLAQSKKVTSLAFDEEKKERIVSAIKENIQMWTKILNYKKLNVREIKEILVKKNIIVESQQLANFLSEKGVMIDYLT